MVDGIQSHSLLAFSDLTWRALQNLAVLGSSSSGKGSDAEQRPNLSHTRLELPTMQLLENAPVRPFGGSPTILVAPYAVHDANIADFAPGHSLARVLLDSGLRPLALTFWKAATPSMFDFGIDTYLSDLNVAVDDLGGSASLVGLCQGGWLAALYAARFPTKVDALVVAGAPLDTGASESRITKWLSQTPSSLVEAAIALNGGRASGLLSPRYWLAAGNQATEAASALQLEPGPDLKARFESWNGRIIDLPGRYYLETSEWLFRENRLAKNTFPALGKACGLADIQCPVYIVAAQDDDVIPRAQAVPDRAYFQRTRVSTSVTPGGHLSLFMGRKTLTDTWPKAAKWLTTEITRA